MAEDETADNSSGSNRVSRKVSKHIYALDDNWLRDVLIGKLVFREMNEFFGGDIFQSRRLAKLRITPVIFAKDKVGARKERV